jgi:hypothetical protein
MPHSNWFTKPAGIPRSRIDFLPFEFFDHTGSDAGMKKAA